MVVDVNWIYCGNILQYIEISNHYVVHLKPYIKKKTNHKT